MNLLSILKDNPNIQKYTSGINVGAALKSASSNLISQAAAQPNIQAAIKAGAEEAAVTGVSSKVAAFYQAHRNAVLIGGPIALLLIGFLAWKGLKKK